jgi:selenide,water dikinase
MVDGFRDACAEADAPITGGQTVLNPWPIIGGVATSVVSKSDFLDCSGAQAGDVVILTKPIGTQVAVNVNQWRREHNETLWNKCIQNAGLTEELADRMMHSAVCSMVRLNRNGARLLLKHGAHACTDVTGFGILGHAQNLSENQVEPVAIEIHTLPCIAGTPAVNANVFDFRLVKGYSAETSGGLMLCIPKNNAEDFMKELQELDDCQSWIIGHVVADASRKSRILQDAKVIDV